MDFCQLIHTAQKNEKNSSGVRCYNTKFEPPKKEQRTKQLSINVKKFLAKKELEEKRKAEEAKKKKEELLALRAQDKKATRRVNVMLKRTKSANQSVIEDAVDDDNTAVTLAGPMQPDEDDYGYVSQEASAFYNKMMEKYNKMPDEPKFNLLKKKVSTNLSSTKDRVKAALEKEREEAMQPHRRKRKHKNQDDQGESEKKEDTEIDESQTPKEEEPPPKKHKPRPAAPIMNFADLLKIAEKKQYEPIIIEQKPKEEEKLLTKKQKKEQEREREWRERREARTNPNSEVEKRQNLNRIPKADGSMQKPSSSGSSTSGGTTDKVLNKDKLASSKTITINSNVRPSSSVVSKPIDPSRKMPSVASSMVKSNGSILNKALTSESSNVSKVMSKSLLPTTRESNIQRSVLSKDMKIKNINTENIKPKEIATNDPKLKKIPQHNMKLKQFPPKNINPKPFPPSDVRRKEFPPADVRRKEVPPAGVRRSDFSPADIRRKEFSPMNMKKKPLVNRGRILDDDESEYDSELDDFIDDGPEEEDDYSKHIKEIFGYDKSRYRDVDDDVDNMESTFAQQMKEEVISTKIGIMEDLEDIRKEEEEKRLKSLKKQRKL